MTESSPEKEQTPPSPVDVEETEAAEPEADNGNGRDLAVLARDTEADSLRELMAVNFIEYASYVIKDRAIPDVCDGLKPVQRRILYALHELDDGRFHKVANVIGHTMQYHPHGDASIGNALVVLANKEYFIEKQGNFGNILTGDQASAARYIECRLTPLAREVLFNSEITESVDSYDGRKREPVTLPAKVPSLLMLGSEGIAVGMTTRVLPHNFNELLKAQIAILRDRSFQVHPDFLSGGVMDVGDYDDGNGRIRLRAKIDEVNDKTLVIREIPATTSTESLINSIEEAARRGKIKIAGINDYTGEQAEIEISLPRGIHAEEAKKQLYAYTYCQVSISSNITVIHNNRPAQMTVSEVLHLNTEQLVADLKRELEIELSKLQERFHEKTLAQIFIENRIYKRIEECETYELVRSEVRAGLEKFRDMLRRDITDEDIEKLLQIQIRRISLFDINKNREELDNILSAIEQTRDRLGHLTEYAIDYITSLRKKYGKAFPRRTQIADLEAINVREVALQNVRVGHDRLGHFVGTDVKNSNKSDDPIVCTEYDRLILLQNNGKFKVVPISDKLYVGPVKYVLKADKRQVYSMVYRHRKRKVHYAKRFRVDKYIMDREYKALPPGCIIENLYTNYGVVVRCELEPNTRLKSQFVDIDFDEVPIRSAAARGFRVTQYPISALVQVKRGSPGPPTPAAEAAGEAAEPPTDEPPAQPVEAEETAAAASETDAGEPAAAAEPTEALAEQEPSDSEQKPPKKKKAPSKPSAASPDAAPVPEPKAKEAGVAKKASSTQRDIAQEWGKRSARAAAISARAARKAAGPRPAPTEPAAAAAPVAEESGDAAGQDATGAPVSERGARKRPSRPKQQATVKAKAPAAAPKKKPAAAKSAKPGKSGRRASPSKTVSRGKAAGAESAAKDAKPRKKASTSQPESPPKPRRVRRRIDEETPFFLE